MGRMVSASDFDARFVQLLAQITRDGETVTIMHDGEVVAALTPLKPRVSGSVFGILRSPAYRSDWDHEAPAVDADEWDALRDDSFPPRP